MGIGSTIIYVDRLIVVSYFKAFIIYDNKTDLYRIFLLPAGYKRILKIRK